jgi:phosphoserine phosphatase
MTRFILIRHGQTEWNTVERFRGRADVPLNQVGMAQAEATGRRIADGYQPTAIYSSPLSRAIRTAEAISQYCSLPIQMHFGLIDIDYGHWQGLTPDEARRRWPDMLETWYSLPQLACIPNGETLSHLAVRTMSMIEELTARHFSKTVVLISHLVVNRVILLKVMGASLERFWRIRQDTCAINVFEADAGGFTLDSLNDTCHLLQGSS